PGTASEFSIVLRDATAFRLGRFAVLAFPDSVSDSRSRARFPVRRPVCLTLLLLAEVLLLQVRFDTSALQGVRTWWSTLIGHAHFLPMIAVAIGSALLVIVRTRFRQEPLQLPEGTWQAHRWQFFLLAHVISLAIFAGCTAQVLEGDLESNSRWPGTWVAAW